MPITTSEVHVDQALTNISLAYAQEQTAFIADKIFGRVSVDKLSNKFHVFSKSDYLRGVAEMRAPGSPTAGANFTLSQQTYSCDQFGVHMDVDDLAQANSDAGVNILTSAATYVTEKLLQKRDQEFAAAAFTTGTWTGSTTGGDITPGTLWILSRYRYRRRHRHCDCLERFGWYANQGHPDPTRCGLFQDWAQA